MPVSVKLEVSVRIPSVDEFAARYPQYGRRAQISGEVFFSVVMTPMAFLKTSFATDDVGLPGVAGIAQECFLASGGDLIPTDKQYIGALVCALMEANGYCKTGKKRAIPHKAFTKGEVYRRA
jgi:hypothetical protein